MRRSIFLAAGLTTAILFGTFGAARAQDRDPTARYDVGDIMDRHPHDVDELPSIAEARGQPVTVDLSLSGTYSTNPGGSRFRRVETGYITPGLGVNLTPISLGGWEVGGGTLVDVDYYAASNNDQFGEGRVEGFIFADRAIGPGTFTAEFIYLQVFDNAFANRDFRLEISDLTYSFPGRALFGDVSAEYQSSDIPELRRVRVTGMVGHTLEGRRAGYEISVEGELAYSDFTGGANRDRSDTTAALVVIAEKPLSRDWTLEWEAAFVKRFSNRQISRFEAIELGVEISKRF